MISKKSLILFAVLTTLAGCQFKKGNDIPEYLIGTWITAHPKYQGVSFQITKYRLIFANIAGGIESYPISNFTNLSKGKLIFNILHLTQEGHPYEFAFYYEPKDSGQIRFKNKVDIAWSKRQS